MQKVELNIDTVNGILDYLQERPFKESAVLIDAIVKDVRTNKKETQTEEALTPRQLLTEEKE